MAMHLFHEGVSSFFKIVYRWKVKGYPNGQGDCLDSNCPQDYDKIDKL